MFAILVSEENLPKILEADFLTPDDKTAIENIYTPSKVAYYFVRGYVDPSGMVWPFTILPGYALDNNFEYDPNKIDTDWDQIVRK